LSLRPVVAEGRVERFGWPARVPLVPDLPPLDLPPLDLPPLDLRDPEPLDLVAIDLLLVAIEPAIDRAC
jgi:hypothetical protein